MISLLLKKARVSVYSWSSDCNPGQFMTERRTNKEMYLLNSNKYGDTLKINLWEERPRQIVAH